VLGVSTVALGSLTSAPSIAETEKLREMALHANRSESPNPTVGDLISETPNPIPGTVAGHMQPTAP
jgi:hypothetical protein